VELPVAHPATTPLRRFYTVLSVTAYSLYQGTSCAATADMLYSITVAVGVLAGLTSVDWLRELRH